MKVALNVVLSIICNNQSSNLDGNDNYMALHAYNWQKSCLDGRKTQSDWILDNDILLDFHESCTECSSKYDL